MSNLNSIKDTRTLRVIPPVPMTLEEMNQERQKRDNKNMNKKKDNDLQTKARPMLDNNNGSKRKSYIESLMSNVNTSKYTTAVSSGQTLSPTISSPQNRIHTINDNFNTNKQDSNNSNSNSQITMNNNLTSSINNNSTNSNNQQWIKKIRGLPSIEIINENKNLFNKIGEKDEKVYSNIRNTVKLDLERIDYLSKNLTISNNLIIKNLNHAVESSNWIDE
ncbi:hypothetical protein B5S28_g4754 [[Candida] boidinii]|nr:hypothetical protein B5S28_g4754 [[Candida] boidinii]OWB63979.1 hypothetical protein B5S29_g5001 [[Candida] boidinii]OWB77502.1 hypothetical protein B5S32_g1670 [[Candida] boidinii]